MEEETEKIEFKVISDFGKEFKCIKGLSGHYTVNYTNGDVYTGEILDGVNLKGEKWEWRV